MKKIKNIHAMASYNAGGAEYFFIRLMKTLHEHDEIDLLPIVKKGSWLSKRLASLKIPHETVFFGGKLDFVTKFKLWLISKKFGADIIQTWLNRAAGRYPKMNDSVMMSRLGGYYNYKHFLKSEYMIGNTEDICDYIRKGPWEADKVVYLPNFVDEPVKVDSKESLLKKYNLPSNKKLILLSGRLHEIKGFDVIIPLMKDIPEEYNLVLAGEGAYRSGLEALVRENGLEGRVHFLGWVDEISEIYTLADIFVIPSKHEPLGNVVLDGWAHKLPVIASKSEGPRVLINDGEDGVLVDIDDVEGFKTAILKVINDKDFSVKIAEKGHAKLQADFSRKSVVEKYLAFYKKALAKAS